MRFRLLSQGKIFMKKSITAAVFTVSLLFSSAQASVIVTETLAFESQGLDLETGNIIDSLGGGSGSDFHFAYNSARPVHTVLFQNYPAQISFLDETVFDSVTYDDTSALSFTNSLIDLPLETDDTVILLTGDGNYFKIGNAFESSTATELLVTFVYQQLTAPVADTTTTSSKVPEPTSIALLGLGIAGLGFTRRKKA